MLRAAATALQLAAEGRITVSGALGGAVQPAAAQHVYDGDRPSPYQTAWQEAMAEVEAALVQARTDRDTARQLRGTAHHRLPHPRPVRAGPRLPFRRRHSRRVPA